MKRMKKDIARVMDEAVARGETPCVLTLVWLNGEEKCFHASGYGDMGRKEPAERENLLRIHSLTKPMTAVAAMTLVERGELDLYAPVSDFLEGFRDQHVIDADGKTLPVNNPMRVYDLLTMTSGLCYPGSDTPAQRAMAKLYAELEADSLAGNLPDTVGVANRMGRAPLAFQPGSRWLYGVSADVLGAVIQAVSGQPLDEYMAEVLFEPLGMRDTGFVVPPEKVGRLATLYEHRDGILSPVLPAPGSLNDRYARRAFVSGGGGLVSTIDDLLAFARMLLAGGELDGERVLSRRGVEWLTHNHLTLAQAATVPWDTMNGYGYGGLMRTMLDPARSHTLGEKGEFGWEGYAGAYMTVCPSAKLILLMLQHCTNSPLSPLMRRVRNIVYARVE
ncbi:MAG: beta-lactamase family protein [Clostridiales bacterium]|nr:beta-lactamase family protein [Clostridiales bacterium]